MEAEANKKLNHYAKKSQYGHKTAGNQEENTGMVTAESILVPYGTD